MREWERKRSKERVEWERVKYFYRMALSASFNLYEFHAWHLCRIRFAGLISKFEVPADDITFDNSAQFLLVCKFIFYKRLCLFCFCLIVLGGFFAVVFHFCRLFFKRYSIYFQCALKYFHKRFNEIQLHSQMDNVTKFLGTTWFCL